MGSCTYGCVADADDEENLFFNVLVSTGQPYS